MISPLDIFVEKFKSFMLVFSRVSSFLAVAPIFGSFIVPVLYRVGLAFWLSLIIYPVVIKGLTIPTSNSLWGLEIVGQAVLGITIGVMFRLFFEVFHLAGQFVGIHMGFGISNVLDPMARIQIPLIGQMQALLATLVFLAINGHHTVVMALGESFKVFPGITMAGASILAEGFFKVFSRFFCIAFQVSAPILISLFLSNVALGILSRAAPQMNVMMLGFQINIILGFVILAFFLPFLASSMRYIFDKMFWEVLKLLNV